MRIFWIVSGITSFTGEGNYETRYLVAWFGFSSRSQGVPYSL